MDAKITFPILTSGRNPDLQIHSHRSPMTQDNNGTSRTSPREGPVGKQKSEAPSHLEDPLQRTLQIKMCGLRGTLCDSLSHTTVSTQRFSFSSFFPPSPSSSFSFYLFLGYTFTFVLFCVGGHKSRGQSQGDREMEGDQGCMM